MSAQYNEKNTQDIHCHNLIRLYFKRVYNNGALLLNPQRVLHVQEFYLNSTVMM